MDFIDLKTQQDRYRKEIESGIAAVLAHGRYINGPEIEKLETELAKFVGAEYAIGVASGTDALEIALRSLGIGPGDEVVTVPFTWISTAEAVALVGAKTVFVDIEADTYNIDLKLIEPAITPRTKAIMPVNLFGQMIDYTALNSLAEKHGLPVIEDAAQSFGATRDGRMSCADTTIACTSFFPAKPLGCYGDGGALFTSDAQLDEKIRTIRNHGGMVRHHHTLVGMNGRLDTLQAAILLAKLPHFAGETEARGRIGGRYSELLDGVCGTPAIEKGNTHVYAQYTIRHPDRDGLGKFLKERGVPTAVYYPKCLHEQPVFEELGYSLGDFPVSEKAAAEVISLPMHPFLSESDQDTVVEAIREYTNAGA